MKKFSAQIKPGEITAICGARNGGRKELVDLMRGRNTMLKEGTLNILGREVDEWDPLYLQSRIVYIDRNTRKLGIRAVDFAGLFLSRPDEVAQMRFFAHSLSCLSHGPESILSYTEDTSRIAESLTNGEFQF